MTPEETLKAAAHTRAREDVLRDVHSELRAQDEKWGEQNHPNGTGPDLVFHRGNHNPTFHGLALISKRLTDHRAQLGTLTYRDIFLEEVFEAMAEHNPDKLRAELIQCAAVAVAWAEKIDRDARRGK